MFVYNLKLNPKKIFIILSIILIIIFAFSCYKIISNMNFSTFKVNDKNQAKNAPILVNSDNYTDILKMVYDNPNEYLGKEISIVGYVYRNFDFSKDQFVIARTMMITEDNQEFVVGFLCSYKDAINFKDNEWVEIKGTISKANYNGEIPCIKVNSIEKTEKPSEEFVLPPHGSYIPTFSTSY